MKKIICAFALGLLVFSANAMPSARVYNVPHRPHQHYHHSTRADNRANTALFVAVGAAMLATVSLIKVSEYNQGQVQIARF